MYSRVQDKRIKRRQKTFQIYRSLSFILKEFTNEKQIINLVELIFTDDVAALTETEENFAIKSEHTERRTNKT